MSVGEIDSEMRRRFEAAEKTRVSETALRRRRLYPTAESLRAHFASEVGVAQAALENPHLEPRVSDEERANAVPASVLLAVVLREAGPTLIVTQRHRGISYPGHWVFPGGRADPSDATQSDTALREAEEEIGLDRSRLEVLGRLGDYVSHSGFRIAPMVALAHPPLALVARPGEVERIEEVPLSRLLDSANYFLYRFEERKQYAHFALEAAADVMLNGLTVSICIGLYSELLKTHGAGREVAEAASGSTE